MKPKSGPTQEHLAVATRLLQLRKEAGISRAEAAAAAGVSTKTVQRIEQAGTRLDVGQVRQLLRCYGAGPQERGDIESLLLDAMQPGWWHEWRSVMPAWQQEILGFESAAALMWMWQPCLVPELLRTPAYAAAVLQHGRTRTDEEIKQRLQLLTERQRRLEEQGTRLSAVLSEAVLWRRVGDAAVMEEQLAALREADASARVTVRVVPLDGPVLPLSTAGPLRLIRSRLPEIADCLVLSGPLGVEAVSDPKVTSGYLELLDEASVTAGRAADAGAPGSLLAHRGGRALHGAGAGREGRSDGHG